MLSIFKKFSNTFNQKKAPETKSDVRAFVSSIFDPTSEPLSVDAEHAINGVLEAHVKLLGAQRTYHSFRRHAEQHDCISKSNEAHKRLSSLVKQVVYEYPELQTNRSVNPYNHLKFLVVTSSLLRDKFPFVVGDVPELMEEVNKIAGDNLVNWCKIYGLNPEGLYEPGDLWVHVRYERFSMRIHTSQTIKGLATEEPVLVH